MHNKIISRRYTTALFEIAAERKVTDRMRIDFLSLKKTIQSSRELKLFIETPIISTEKKKSVFKEIFSGKLDDLLISFFDLLAEKGRENLLYEICTDFVALMNDKEGIIEARITTAIEIRDSEKKNLEDKLREFTGKKIASNYFVDPSIKGGFVVRIDDTIIDASIRKQLEMLHEQFRKGSFTNN